MADLNSFNFILLMISLKTALYFSGTRSSQIISMSMTFVLFNLFCPFLSHLP